MSDRLRQVVAGALARAARRPNLRLHLALAACAYIPLLLTRPGWVSADTKTYLYLDPSRLLSRAWSMWDPSIGLGTVTHQNIGYLWPMGPFFWLTERLGVPDWTAQRLWWGSIIFLAGAGVAYLLRTLGWKGPGVTAATFLYAFTPYLLTLVARLSAILLPFAALPWLLALTIRTLRHRGWRYPAMFAVAVTTFGSVNATALLLVGLAPLLWLLHAVWVAREATIRQAAVAVAKIGALTVPASAWWIAGLSVQSTNGIDILQYTETAEVVSQVSTSHEVLRSLGYWFFYGGDRLGPWIEPSVSYTTNQLLLFLSFALPVLSLLGAATARWRHRAFFVGLVLVGLTLAVGAYPWDDGPLVSRAFQVFLESDLGLAMRSLPRAVPLVALGLAVLLASGVASAGRRWPQVDRWAGVGVALVALLALPPLWLGQLVPDNLRREEELPDYWHEAADHLDAVDGDTRVLAVPGSDFASYRWGNTVDPVLPGLMDRPSVARELIPYGSPASANLLNALDLGLQERTASPDAIAPIARLMRAGDVLVISDLQYERYNTPRPVNFWDFISHTPGLDDPVTFGPGVPNETIEDVQLHDELFLVTDPELPHPPELAAFPVEDPLPVVTAQSASNPVLVAGDGYGLVNAAAQGLIDGSELIRYSAEMDDEGIISSLENDGVLVLTDSNRRRGERWTTVRHTRGYTETADGGVLSDDPTDNRLPVFEDEEAADQTIVENRSGIQARATSYGNPVSFTAEERPALALDGNSRTAWRTAAFSDARGERLELTLSEPVTTDHIMLQQPTEGSVTRFISEVRLRFDGGDAVDVPLGPASRGGTGEIITFDERTFEHLSIEILGDTEGELPRYVGQSSVGFSQVVIGGDERLTEEAVRLPTDLLSAAGSASIDHPLAVSMSRIRQDPTEVTRGDEEEVLHRLFTLPSERSFTVTGTGSITARAPDHVRDDLVGRPHDDTVPWVRASDSLSGSVTPAAAYDGDPSTIWQTLRSRPQNQWLEIVLPEEETIDSLPVELVTDEHHSLPTEIELWVDGEVESTLEVPPLERSSTRNDTTRVELDLPGEVTGSRFRIKLTGIDTTLTNDWVSENQVAQPAAIAEVELGDAPLVPDLPDEFDSGCRDDIVTVDDEPFPVRYTGSVDDALAGGPLDVTACDGRPLAVEGGNVEIETVNSREEGWAVDHLTLRSAAGGGPSDFGGTLMTEARQDEAVGGSDDDNGGDGRDGGAEDTTGPGDGNAGAGTTGAAGAATPEIEVVGEEHDSSSVEVTGADPDTPFWLVLGQSHNEGWEATVDGQSLGPPNLVNGYANGWLIVPTEENFTVDLQFQPQQRVTVALWISLVAVIGCLALLFRRPRPAYTVPSSLPEPYSPVLAFRYDGALPPRRTAVLTGLALGALGTATAGLGVGLVVGLAAGFATRHEKFRRWLVLAAPVILTIAALYVLQLQFRHGLRPSIDWPIETSRVHPLGWLSVWLIVADVVVGRLWQSHSSERGDHE